MSTNPNRGRVYRRCACRDTTGKQLGARCPTLARDRRHGTWTFAVDLPSLDGRRATMRRGGFASRTDAQTCTVPELVMGPVTWYFLRLP